MKDIDFNNIFTSHTPIFIGLAIESIAGQLLL